MLGLTRLNAQRLSQRPINRATTVEGRINKPAGNNDRCSLRKRASPICKAMRVDRGKPVYQARFMLPQVTASFEAGSTACPPLDLKLC